MKALLIVDVQRDFCPQGALAVPDGDKIVPVINNLMDNFDLVIASKDWHKEGTKHFERWQKHCIENTPGAEFHPDLRTDKINIILYKGTGLEDAGYSAFEATNIDLEDFLRKQNVDELHITGLALDFCVKATALDAIKRGFKTYIILKATRGLSPESEEEAIYELKKAGVIFI